MSARIPPTVSEQGWQDGSPSGASSLIDLSGEPGRLHWRERRMFYLLLGAWIINSFDLILTLLAYQQNLLVELNPVAARVLPHGSMAIVTYKVGMLMIGTAALWYCRRHWATEPAVWAYLVLCVGLSFWWHRLLHEADPTWMMANTAERVLPDPYRSSIPTPSDLQPFDQQTPPDADGG